MENENPNSFRTSSNFAQVLIRSWAMSIYLPLRRGIGKDHVGVTGIVAFFLIPLYAGFAAAPEIIWLLPIFILSAAAHRFDGATRRARGIYEHTYYVGETPLVRRLFRLKDDLRAKQVGEPALSFIIGCALLPYGQSVGGYFLIGAVMLGLNQAMIEHQEQRRVDDHRNAMIENQGLTGQFQHRGRRRF